MTDIGWFHVKHGEKRSTSKSTIFMKKHKRIVISKKIFVAIFSIFFLRLSDFFLNSQKRPVYKSSYLTIYFVIQCVIVGRNKFNIYLRYSKHLDFYVYLLCLNFLGTFLTVLGIFTYFNIAESNSNWFKQRLFLTNDAKT